MSEENNESTETENQASEAEESQTDDSVEYDSQEETDGTDESGTDESQEASQTDEHFINQEQVQKKINKIHFEKQEETRKREAVEAKLLEAENKLKSTQKSQAEIFIPPVPDAYDPNYKILVQRRDDAITKKAAMEEQSKFALQQQQDAQQRAALENQQNVKSIAEKLYTSAEELGIKAEDLQKADARVAMFIKDPALARHIIGHEDGPLIIKHLANNATELEKISVMDSITASAHIERTIAPQARKLKPDLTQAPDPLKIPGGRGAGEKKNKFLEGVTFE